MKKDTEKLKFETMEEYLNKPYRGLGSHLEYLEKCSEREKTGGRIGDEKVWWDIYQGRYWLNFEDDMGNLREYILNDDIDEKEILRVIWHMTEKCWIDREYVREMIIMMEQAREHEKKTAKNKNILS